MSSSAIANSDFYEQVGNVIQENNKVIKILAKKHMTKEAIYIGYLMLALSARKRLKAPERVIQLLEAEAAINVNDMMFQFDNR